MKHALARPGIIASSIHTLCLHGRHSPSVNRRVARCAFVNAGVYKSDLGKGPAAPLHPRSYRVHSAPSRLRASPADIHLLQCEV